MNQHVEIRESEIVERATLVSNVRTAEVAALIVQCGGNPCGSCKQFPRDAWGSMPRTTAPAYSGIRNG